MKTFKQRMALLAALVCVSLAGCGGGSSPESTLAEANSTNIQRLSNLYFTFQMKHEWKGPKDEAEFKEFLRSYNPDKLSRIGIDASAIDDLFVGERDNQPFKIRYSVVGSMLGSSEPVIFEAEGKNGSRRVGFLNMEHRDVEAAEYDKLWSEGLSDSAMPTGRQ